LTRGRPIIAIDVCHGGWIRSPRAVGRRVSEPTIGRLTRIASKHRVQDGIERSRM
jgi:hypothetical protein